GDGPHRRLVAEPLRNRLFDADGDPFEDRRCDDPAPLQVTQATDRGIHQRTAGPCCDLARPGDGGSGRSPLPLILLFSDFAHGDHPANGGGVITFAGGVAVAAGAGPFVLAVASTCAGCFQPCRSGVMISWISFLAAYFSVAGRTLRRATNLRPSKPCQPDGWR